MSAPSLAAWGIQRPDETVAAAASSGLPLAVAASLLEQESGGGHNVWGSDKVETGGAYTKGSPVTREAYLAYRSLVKAGKAGHQGVGPVQLTAEVFQARADALGGCWDPVVNMRVGFLALADLVHAYGLPDGIRRYNGSGPAAEHYRDQMLARVRKWTDRLGATPAEDDMPLTDADVDRIATATAAKVLNAPLADLYLDPPMGRMMPLAAHVQWAAANAGRALAVAKQVQASAGGSVDYDALAAAILRQLVAHGQSS